ncbi:MAG TPA: phage tail sheath subtilisin-like domain-containing protein [Thermoanaerobaculia bacterium]|nr:phage tail sheath subtilisin-like domain-containing protein [Thermoanaerobaculia bacterium]
MPELLHPGVYVQEVPAAVKPIEGVSTSTAAFVGVADKGPIPGTTLPNGRPARAFMVTSFTEYTRNFGGFRLDSYLTYAVRGFFDNGGRRLYIIRVAPSDVATATVNMAASPVDPASTLAISASSPGAWGAQLWVQVAPASDGDGTHFRLAVMQGATLADASANVVESFDNLTFRSANANDPLPVNYVRNVVNSRSEFIAVTGNITARPGDSGPTRLAVPAGSANGGDGTLPLAASAYTGQPAATSTVSGTGMRALDKVTDVNILAMPGQGDVAAINAAMAYCKNTRALQDCFFIGDIGELDPLASRDEGAQPSFAATVADARDFILTGHGGTLDKSAGDYGALYYPWIRSTDPIGVGRNPLILLPPSGHVAGLYARIDNSRGVFKAPAGTEAGVAGALSAATIVGDTDQDRLNPINLNVIRVVPTSGIVVWGARTIGSDPGWRYVPVRRMAIFLRTSIYYGIQWAVFEPNDAPLWSSLRLNIRAFMLTQFRAGAFQGSKPDDAFFVICDATTTTQQDIDNGVVNILVGFAPLKPAEFVVLKLSQKVNQTPA